MFQPDHSLKDLEGKDHCQLAIGANRGGKFDSQTTTSVYGDIQFSTSFRVQNNSYTDPKYTRAPSVHELTN